MSVEQHDRPSALYTGSVMHQRLRPRRHRLAYRMFWLLLDVDELPTLARRLRLFSLNRFNLFSLRERNYGAGDGSGLRAHVDAQLRIAGLPDGGAIRLLTMPRILGYAFNPLNVYFCHAPGGDLCAVLYEVNNTFGERHGYLIEVDPAHRRGGEVTQHCAKQFHVSPFLELKMRYGFRLQPPDAAHEALRLAVTVADAQGVVLVAQLEAQRQPLRDAALARVFVSFPLLTLKVIAGIHWEALRLWAKGVLPHARPPAPTRPVTTVKTERT